LDRTDEPVDPRLLDKRLLARINAARTSACPSGVRPLAAIRMPGRNPWLIRIISASTIGAPHALPLGA
jgi:hypothetical protein